MRWILPVLLLTHVPLSADPAAMERGNEGSEFIADIDRNGKNDKVVQVRHEVDQLFPGLGMECRLKPGVFLRYILYRDSGDKGEEVLDYLIGSKESSYWVHRIEKLEDINQDGSSDLVFYAGDDTTEEYVFILQKSSHFLAVSTGTLGPEEYKLSKDRNIVAYDDGSSVVAKWSSTAEAFESDKVAWISGDCVSLRSGPSIESDIVRRLFRGDIVRLSPKEACSGEWCRVGIWTDEGYVNKHYLSTLSPRKQFGGAATH